MSSEEVKETVTPTPFKGYLPEGEKNPMRRIIIDKVVVNMAVGQSGERLAKAAKVLEELTGQKPCPRKAKRTIKEFGIRKGENIAVIVTLRGRKAYEFLDKAFEAVGRTLKASSIDRFGNFSFGISEHIQIPGTRYDPEIGIFGMDVCVSLARPGFRIMRRKRKRSYVAPWHRVSKEEAIEFLERTFNVKVV